MKPSRFLDMEESGLRPEYHSISCELRELAKMVRDEFGNEGPRRTGGGIGKGESLSANSTPLFERGRFYEEYSSRRNERLRRKMGQTGEDAVQGKVLATPYNLGVTVESSKRRDSKKLESLRKSVSAAYSVERSETHRYMLRSMSRENKKPPLSVNNSNFERSVLPSERKIGSRRVRKV
ncbi:hypothetical protein Tsubulata_031526 [Turnera subulata]|uniref:Uncharacterized protein n=1 Tax=Turnera subulata TaxID=218843 RepID=A0A9Q0JPY9_9ROSI|nr:hypothetical protein Tsubulata_031526 [Turnera subulata]